jgi:hypothetical protein
MNFFRKHRKWVSIFVLVAIVAASSVIAVNVMNPGGAEACRDQGCNVYFWKTNTTLWSGHTTSEPLRHLFSEADRYNVGDTSLLNVLFDRWSFNTTNQLDVDARGLLKQGVAAKLNTSCSAIDYHVSGSQVTQMVNDALKGSNHHNMYVLRETLDTWNNAGCPLLK